MRFDDRLATVLRHRATGPRAARTQFRQLLDLLDAARSSRDKSQFAAAWLRLGALGEVIPAADRVAILRDPSIRIRSPELTVHLAEDEPGVAAAALAKAELSSEEWEVLIPRLPIRARGFLRLRRNLPPGTVALLDRLGIHDRGLPQPDVVADIMAPTEVEPLRHPDDIPSPAPPDIADPDESDIGALVKRIEAFRVARSAGPAEPGDAPRLPLGDRATHSERRALAGFGFTTDSHGRIDWADGEVASSVIGLRLADCLPGDAPMLARRQPLCSQPATIVGAALVAGAWVVDAAPRFTDGTGAFGGYAGRFRRRAEAASDSRPADNPEADRMRQLLHELRTPVNAIQGYAEVIQQQLFSAVPHEYRALAATIAGDAARIMAGFDEMDRLARLETGAYDVEPGACDISGVVSRQLALLGPVIEPRMAAIEARLAPPPCPVALSPEAGEALVWRMLATLAGAAGAGERIQLTLDRTSREVLLGCEIPASLAGEADIFAATARASSGALSAGAFGAGFSLRLVRAEARAIGGSLARVEDVLLLVLPLLTGIEPVPSASEGVGGGTARG